jgi:hypothetical protein
LQALACYNDGVGQTTLTEIETMKALKPKHTGLSGSVGYWYVPTEPGNAYSRYLHADGSSHTSAYPNGMFKTREAARQAIRNHKHLSKTRFGYISIVSNRNGVATHVRFIITGQDGFMMSGSEPMISADGSYRSLTDTTLAVGGVLARYGVTSYESRWE